MSATTSSPVLLAPEALHRRLMGQGAVIVGALLVAMLVIFRLTQHDAFSPDVLSDILNNALPLALAAGGGTLVVLTRGFDLSVAGVISLGTFRSPRRSAMEFWGHWPDL